MENQGTLKWRFDVSTFRLIGRDLITDRITALFELVKNSYDANAQTVNVTFKNVAAGENGAVITIEDDGFGMSFEDIRDKWMVIGTSSKRKEPYTPEPFSRKCVGEKGIGRFAVDKLGDKVTIITKKAGEKEWLNVDIDWTAYYNSQNGEGITLFTDIENQYKFTPCEDSNASGTKLIVTGVREVWTKIDIQRFVTEVSKIVSPYANLNFPFQVKVKASSYDIDVVATRNQNDVDIATVSFSLGYDNESETQDAVHFDDRSSTIVVNPVPLKSFGGIKMKVFYFDEAARRKYRKEFPNNEIDGIKIYRDGIITTPFAESKTKDDEKRDVLGIDKRVWENIFDRVSSREIIGIVEITMKDNPKIIDATNRQDFVDNEEYRELKRFIITQLDAIENYKKFARIQKKKKSQDTLDATGEIIQDFITSVETITKEKPELKKSFEPVIQQAKKTDRAVKNVIRERKEAEEEFSRKENIYMSIMSLQEYAIHITHAVRTTLNKIRDRVEYFKNFFPNPDEDDLFLEYAGEMYDEFMILNRVIDYMLSYSQSNLHPEDINLSLTLTEVLAGYSDLLQSSGITLETSLPKRLELKNTNRQFFRDILQNLMDNSIKAVKDSDPKIIKCTAYAEDDDLVILVSDTGNGIPKEKREWVFGLYNTTTEDQGGAGIGLYVVKTRVESLKGTVSVEDSEFGDVGTTVKIVLPFKK
ncbi:MAG: ATP-binding protein [Bacteroidales bacterium]|nr:ATP-binding protein [Bacteroidales bacterium]